MREYHLHADVALLVGQTLGSHGEADFVILLVGFAGLDLSGDAALDTSYQGTHP
jgi:hypothetical protein